MKRLKAQLSRASLGPIKKRIILVVGFVLG
jgi:hypothetical protein